MLSPYSGPFHKPSLPVRWRVSSSPWIQSYAFDSSELHPQAQWPIKTGFLFSKHIFQNSRGILCLRFHLLSVAIHLKCHLPDNLGANSHFFRTPLAFSYLIRSAFPTLRYEHLRVWHLLPVICHLFGCKLLEVQRSKSTVSPRVQVVGLGYWKPSLITNWMDYLCRVGNFPTEE